MFEQTLDQIEKLSVVSDQTIVVIADTWELVNNIFQLAFTKFKPCAFNIRKYSIELSNNTKIIFVHTSNEEIATRGIQNISIVRI